MCTQMTPGGITYSHFHRDRPQNIGQQRRRGCGVLSAHICLRWWDRTLELPLNLRPFLCEQELQRHRFYCFPPVSISPSSFHPLISVFLSGERRRGFPNHKSFIGAIKGKARPARPSELSLPALLYPLETRGGQSSQDLLWKSFNAKDGPLCYSLS